MKKLIFIFLILTLGASGYYLYLNFLNQKFLPGFTEPITQKIENITQKDVSIFLENLDVPWEVAFIDIETLLVTERKGNLLLIKNQKIIKSFPITETNQSGEGGLLGIAIHPKFKENNFIYLYVTTIQNNKRENRVLRYTLKDELLKFDRNILTDIRANIFHNAGKISFGPDGFLYITAGDALDEPAAQDRNQLAGKILRVTDEGRTPEDNPFGNQIYSIGHRNPQGLTWDKDGNLWSTEHGQSGAVSGLDELNKIIKGMNYGWPDYRGFQNADGFVSPEIHSGKETWAPGDTEFYNGIIYFTGLRGEALYGYNPINKELKKYFGGEYGRLRALTLGPDGFFYISTSNRDGRGTPKEKDDKIIKVNPQLLK